MTGKRHYRALTIAGSDSGGGAGIQADLKTFSALGCYGMSVITALTAQNTVTVKSIHEVPVQMVIDQMDAVLSDIGVDVVKIGMLQSPEIIAAVSEVLDRYAVCDIVIDPVMVAKSGDRLLRKEAIDTLKRRLIPKARIITPNLPEAEVLLARKIKHQPDMESAASGLLNLGPQAVLLKGGHMNESVSDDCLCHMKDGSKALEWLKTARIDTKNTHGTGCTLSSAIAAFLARGFELEAAVREAKNYITAAIKSAAGMQLGSGHGPVNHFFAFRPDA